ncbi:MAG: hypothetical protein M4579_001083 [Chaenotheca gracillima]|nr:MAG: hypothetical protein M4579_001083 [Chaenotheca gracillima]
MRGSSHIEPGFIFKHGGDVLSDEQARCQHPWKRGSGLVASRQPGRYDLPRARRPSRKAPRAHCSHRPAAPTSYLPTTAHVSDSEAAAAVESWFGSRRHNAVQRQAEHELSRLLVAPRFFETDIHDVLKYADELFFEERLKTNVSLEWSRDSQECFQTAFVGTTELRPVQRGFETRIILSRPLLQSGQYDQRLVISAILHEAIHSYLFIRRGFEARADGGHTKGFCAISKIINDWVGDRIDLHLCQVEADLTKFLTLREYHGWDENSKAWGAHQMIWVSRGGQ